MGNINRALHGHIIRLGDLILGVRQLLSQLTVVGEQHQTFATAVQPPDREQPLFIWH
jgi:hypothetical protein